MSRSHLNNPDLGSPDIGDSDVVARLLADQSYHIEFNGHLTNHVKHAVVALAGLGAPPERIQGYYDNYARMTTYGSGLEPSRPATGPITEATWERFLGQRVNFAGYCAFYDRQVGELGMPEVLRRYVPRLLPGWTGSFTHAAIHLGWGLDAGSRFMAVEGLAYLAFSYVTDHPERTLPPQGEDRTVVDSLLRIAGAWDADRDALRQWALELSADTAVGIASGIHPELARSGLQYRIARMLGEGHPLIYATPAWLDGCDPEGVWEQLYYASTLLYLAAPGDFVLLHLITSLHGLEQIAQRTSGVDQRQFPLNFWIGLLGIVFSGGDFPRRAKLAALHAAFDGAIDAGGERVWEPDWRHIVARAIEEDEEHNPKLVYVLRRMWRRTGRCSIYRAAAGQFTATPALPPSFEEPPTE